MKTNINGKILVCLMLLVSFQSVHAQLLKGTVKGDVKSLEISYSFSGDMLENVYHQIQPLQDGSFSFNIEDMPVEVCDVIIATNKGNFGAHLQKGKTAVIHLTIDATGKGKVEFEGDNQEVSRFYNRFVHAFDYVRYFSMSSNDQKTIDSFRALLDSEYEVIKKLLPIIPDDNLRTYYSRLVDGKYDWQRIRFIMDEIGKTGKKLTDYPEFNERISRVDPNDPLNIVTDLSITWLLSKQKSSFDRKGDMTEHYFEIMELTDKYITHFDVRRTMANYIANSFFSFSMQNSDVNKFWTRFKDFAKSYPNLIAMYEPRIKAFHLTVAGAEVPYVPVLTRSDGTTCKLSDLYGKLIYMDIWATWCGPCCAEIPFMEKVAAHYRGNDNVHIISVSTDRNQQAWLKKLETDRPEWPQYILSKEENQKFMKAWGINGIPRFVLIGKNGKILNADAPRPSDENIIKLLDANL